MAFWTKVWFDSLASCVNYNKMVSIHSSLRRSGLDFSYYYMLNSFCFMAMKFSGVDTTKTLNKSFIHFSGEASTSLHLNSAHVRLRHGRWVGDLWLRSWHRACEQDYFPQRLAGLIHERLPSLTQKERSARDKRKQAEEEIRGTDWNLFHVQSLYRYNERRSAKYSCLAARFRCVNFSTVVNQVIHPAILTPLLFVGVFFGLFWLILYSWSILFFWPFEVSRILLKWSLVLVYYHE